MSDSLLKTIGARVRSRREHHGWSRRELSEISGISERFIAQLESGRANISVLRLQDLAEALGTAASELLRSRSARRTIALLGVRGAGKSTVGEALARTAQRTFVELDHAIARTAGLSLAEIFEVHGEAYYRRVEREVLAVELNRDQPLVLATGGSIVTDTHNYGLLKQHTTTIWLKATAEDHWERVIRQGDARPMAKNPHAFSELGALLEARTPLYEQAEHVVCTSGLSAKEVVDVIVARIALTTASPLPQPL